MHQKYSWKVEICFEPICNISWKNYNVFYWLFKDIILIAFLALELKNIDIQQVYQSVFTR